MDKWRDSGHLITLPTGEYSAQLAPDRKSNDTGKSAPVGRMALNRMDDGVDRAIDRRQGLCCLLSILIEA